MPRPGKRAWRFYTIPGEGEPGNDTWTGDSWKRGGAPTWVTGAYDPELNMLYWGTGNPGPQMYGANRARRQPLLRFAGRARCRHRPR